ncbi:MAG: FHA domain-containing protein [Gammaproteobacteria bacterium]|nr:FHA domain-containing protein [Gammaproteobacteria bacterium]
MEKLVILNGEETKEFILDRDEVKLGRDQSNDLCLSDKSVSRHHADVVKISSSYFLEDAKSTNGTRLNGFEIKKHILKNGDEIDIGKYKLRFLEEAANAQGEDLDKTVVLRPLKEVNGPQVAPLVSQDKRSTFTVPSKQARIRFLAGPEEGEMQDIDKAFFTIGKPGGNLILINRRHTGYFLLKMGGDVSPSVNGEAVRAGGMELQDGDRVKLGELHFEFIL